MNRRILDSKRVFNFSLFLPYLILIVFLIVIPFILMVLYSFKDNTNTERIKFTFENYSNIFTDKTASKLMYSSIKLSAIATLICLAIGYPLAYSITFLKRRTQVLCLSLITAPMWINMLIKVLSIKQVLEILPFNILGTNSAIVLGLVYSFLPFMVLPIYAILSKMDNSLKEAAADLGANNFKTFKSVVLPLSLPGVFSGILLVFLPAATSVVIPKYLGNGRYLIGNFIEQHITQSGRFGFGSAIAIVFSLIMIVILLLIKVADRIRYKWNERQ